MCWPHANRKIKDHLKPITSINKTLSQQVLEDVETFQWIVTPSSFEKDLKSLENKYLKERESTEQVPAVQAPVVQVQEVPGQEEVQGHEVQVPAVQEVVQEDSRVTCTFCHSKVSKKSLKGHERTQKCCLSRPALTQKRGAEESAPRPPPTRRRVARGSK